MKKLIMTLIIASTSLSANADIYSRIDSCERSGGRTCIFSLLRELAGKKGQEEKKNSCKCEGKKAESVSSKCFMKYESVLTLNGSVVNIQCNSTKDQAYLSCMKRRKTTSVCLD